MNSTEYVVTEVPFVVRRRVKWGECDPAGVVYTVTFAEYVISIAELFYGYLFQSTPQCIRDEYRFATPTRALTFDFRKPLWPDQEFDMEVEVEDIRSRTYTLKITGRELRGDEIFIADLTPICLARGERKAIDIPAPFRSHLERYRQEARVSSA